MENVKYTLTFFGSNTALEPNPENFTYFINKFNFLGTTVPNILQEFNQSGQSNRLQMRSVDNEWTISFLGDKIVIEWVNKFEKDLNFETFKNFSYQALADINSKTSQIFYRVGFSSSYLFRNLDEQKLNEIYFKLNTNSDLNKGQLPVEWSNRFVFRYNIESSDFIEEINCISEIKSAEGHILKNGHHEQFKGILFDSDINTYQGNQSPRFYFENVKGMVDLLIDQEIAQITILQNFI